MAVKDGEPLAVLAEGRHLKIVDLSDPSEPRLLGRLTLPQSLKAVALSGPHAYVTGQDGLWVIDVSNPAAPLMVGFYETPGFPSGVVVASTSASIE